MLVLTISLKWFTFLIFFNCRHHPSEAQAAAAQERPARDSSNILAQNSEEEREDDWRLYEALGLPMPAHLRSSTGGHTGITLYYN